LKKSYCCGDPEYYSRLASKCCERRINAEGDIYGLSAKDVVNPYFAGLIGKDVPRSWSSLPGYDTPCSRADLEEVLLAYSVHNPRIGYTQGMSVICALALTEMEKEWAFWFLVYVVRALPYKFFHSTARTEVNLFITIVEHHAPMVKEHLEEEDLLQSICYLLVPWFMALFVQVLPTETTLAVWDFIFDKAIEGDEMILSLHRVAFALLEIHSGVLLSEHRQSRQAYLEVFEQCKAKNFDIENEDTYGYGSRLNRSGSCGETLMMHFASRVEQTSGFLFVHNMLERARNDRKYSRITRVANDLTIESSWLAKHRMKMQSENEKEEAVAFIQQAYKKHIRKKTRRKQLEEMRNTRKIYNTKI